MLVEVLKHLPLRLVFCSTDIVLLNAVGDCQGITGQLTQRVAEVFYSQLVLVLGLETDPAEVTLQVCVSVGLKMGKINRVKVIQELVGERKRVALEVICLLLLLTIWSVHEFNVHQPNIGFIHSPVLFVAYILACSVPSHAHLFKVLLAEDEGLHSFGKT